MSYVGKEARLNEERARLEQQERDRRLGAFRHEAPRGHKRGLLARLLGAIGARPRS